MVGPGLNVDIASCSLYPKNTSTRKETSSFRNRVGVRLIRKLCAYFTIHQCTSADQIRSICIFSHAAVFPKKKNSSRVTARHSSDDDRHMVH